MNNKRYNQEGEEVTNPMIGMYYGCTLQLDCERYNEAKTIKQWIELAEERGELLIVAGRIARDKESELKAKDKSIKSYDIQVGELQNEVNVTRQELERLKKVMSDLGLKNY